jgi:hypothetical protein
MIRIKRVYDPPGPQDGYQILIDRLWPRGLSKDKACITSGAKTVHRVIGCESGSTMNLRSGKNLGGAIAKNLDPK